MMSAVRGLLPHSRLVLTSRRSGSVISVGRIQAISISLPELSLCDIDGKEPNDGERQHVTEVSRQMRLRNTGSGAI